MGELAYFDRTNVVHTLLTADLMSYGMRNKTSKTRVETGNTQDLWRFTNGLRFCIYGSDYAVVDGNGTRATRKTKHTHDARNVDQELCQVVLTIANTERRATLSQVSKLRINRELDVGICRSKSTTH